MINVGFCGGSEVRELGSASDMRVFFSCLNLAFKRTTAPQSNLITDRLFRRYLRLDELEAAMFLIDEARHTLSAIPVDTIKWEEMGLDRAATALDVSRGYVSDVLKRYLDGIQRIISNAIGYQKRFGEYRPVMTIISDLPRLHIDEIRPLAEYDALEGDPMWLRP